VNQLYWSVGFLLSVVVLRRGHRFKGSLPKEVLRKEKLVWLLSRTLRKWFRAVKLKVGVSEVLFTALDSLMHHLRQANAIVEDQSEDVAPVFVTP